MKRWLWIVPAVLSLPFWAVWVLLLLASTGEGAAEPRDAQALRTVAWFAALGLSITAALLHPPTPGPPPK